MNVLQRGKFIQVFLGFNGPTRNPKRNCYVNLWRELVCDTWEEEEEEEEEEQEQETKNFFVAGELGCGGSHTFKVIVVKKQNCKKFLLKINMHGSLLAS